MKQNLKIILISFLLIVAVLNLPSAWFSVTKYFDKDLGTSVTEIAVTTNLADYPAIQNTNVNNLNAGKIEVSTTTLPLLTTLTGLVTTGTIGTGVWEGTTIDELFGGTGFSTYTTGDILFASASNVLSKLAVGSNNEVLTVTGGVPVWASITTDVSADFTWTGTHIFNSNVLTVNAGLIVNNATSTEQHFVNTPTIGTNFDLMARTASTTTFTASGTHTKSTGVTMTLVELWGGGGGSGGTLNNSDAGGGGGGSYIRIWFLPSDIGTTETVTIGAAGAAGASGDNDGGNGGDTTFGSLATAFGGKGGDGGATAGTDKGGAGAGSGLTNTAQAENTSSFDVRGGGNGATFASGGNAVKGGGGGGGSGGPNNIGGNSFYGGGGGAGGDVLGSSQSGGTSTYGGNGGAGGQGDGVEEGVAGSAPSGGGGGPASSGDGAFVGQAGGAGQMIITEFF